MGGNVSNFTQKVLKLFGEPLLYTSKQTKCKTANIDILKVECFNCDGHNVAGNVNYTVMASLLAICDCVALLTLKHLQLLLSL